MPRFVVLLRGVNVGKGNRIAMASFRALLESLGFTGVKTLLNSGNAVFDAGKDEATAHAAAIHAGLLAKHSLDVVVVVKSAAEWASIVAGNPFQDSCSIPSRLLVVLCQDRRMPAVVASIGELANPPEVFASNDHAAYLHCAGGILESKAASALLGNAGRSLTTRNWATVLKLAGLLGAS